MSRFWIACSFMLIAFDGQTTRAENDPARATPKPVDTDARRVPLEVTDSDLPGLSAKTKASDADRRRAQDGFQTIPLIDPGMTPFRRSGREQKIFDFKIDPKTPLSQLLPTGSKAVAHTPDVFNEDLARVRELMFDEPFGKDVKPDDAMEKIAHQAAKIRFLNSKTEDGFIRELRAHRLDLQGLPFLLGKECRSRNGMFVAFAASRIRLAPLLNRNRDGFWDSLKDKDRTPRLFPDYDDGPLARMLIQLVPPGSDHHDAGLPRFLDGLHGSDSAQALAKLAIYSPETAVRDAAISCLKKRAFIEYVDVLLQAFRYPLPVVAERAAEAVIQLKCKDALPELVNVLDRLDPRAPFKHKVEGNETPAIRELVRVNHHRNCLLCHVPANSNSERPERFLSLGEGVIPLPGDPFPLAYYSSPPSPDLVVRFDITYLRQDFSLMMPVEDAAPWPEMQRFDFLVRTRVLTHGEAKEIGSRFSARALSPYHRHALRALRQLTGQDAGTSAKAWREFLAASAK